MSYTYWLAGLSVAFVVLERIRPRYKQAILRRGIVTDLFYLVFNGHFLGVGIAAIAAPVITHLDTGLESVRLRDTIYLGVARELPAWSQFIIALVAIDLLHWCIHNLLHRVPWLWELHKVHHSIVTMDWIGSMRFHWSEGIIYKSLTYPVLAFLGFDLTVLLGLAVLGTAIGHFNHANLGVSIGPLKYVLNNPAMHVWHHGHPDAGPVNRNFGISLSLWDWLFGTAYLPESPPERLGFSGIETFPRTVPGQLLHPVPVERHARQMIARRNQQRVLDR